MNELMTDYQFKTILKMILEILNTTSNIEEAREKVADLLDNEKED